MADYKFNGTELRGKGGNKIAVTDGKNVRDRSGSKVGSIDGKYIRDSKGSKLAEFNGKDIRDAHGKKLGTIDDVKKSIDGEGGASLVALWLLFVR